MKIENHTAKTFTLKYRIESEGTYFVHYHDSLGTDHWENKLYNLVSQMFSERPEVLTRENYNLFVNENVKDQINRIICDNHDEILSERYDEIHVDELVEIAEDSITCDCGDINCEKSVNSEHWIYNDY